MENKNIAITVLTIALLTSVGIIVQPDDTHYCQERNITYHCDNFSKYYGLENGKCINNLKSNKLCRGGWVEINFDNTKVIMESDYNAEYFKCFTDGKPCKACKRINNIEQCVPLNQKD